MGGSQATTLNQRFGIGMTWTGRQRRGLLAAYSAGVIAVTLAPVPDISAAPSLLDEAIHFGLFAVLAPLLHWNLKAGSPVRRTTAIVTAVLVVVLAGLIELLQGPLPYRSGDLGDFLAGTVGGLLGAAAAHSAARRSKGT